MKRLLTWMATAATLSFVTGVNADQTDPRLNALFRALRGASSPEAAESIEAQIWTLWTSSGNPEVDRLMAIGIAAMNRERYDLALGAFNQVVARAPKFAEGWNKRATVFYLLGDFQRSVEDVERTLALEPRHFGALSGLGMIALALGEDERALDAFEAALEIHPFLAGRDTHIKALRDRVRGRGI